MKIHQLPMGARFTYEGIEYVKNGPQLASGPSGQRLIPKYAVLTPLDNSVAPIPKKADALARSTVEAAFAAYQARCAALVSTDRLAEFRAAGDAFLSSLK